MKKTILILFLILCLNLLCGCVNNTTNIKDSNINNTTKENKEMNEFVSKINITMNNKTFTATLEDNETSRELISRLPLNIIMNELNDNEKYYYFDNSLPSNSKKVDKINNGDIMLYGTDCLVIFYDTFNTNYSYTKIGKIDNSEDLKEVVGTNDIEVYISK